jgi:hypothetical protein
MIDSRPSSAVGIFDAASSKLAVLESFLPTGTSQYGPPTCQYYNWLKRRGRDRIFSN